VPPEHKALFRTCQPITGPGGSAIVVVLLLTAALTVLGVMSINSGLIELQLVLNGKESTKRFYLAESAALEGIQRIADTSAIDLEDKTLHWHHAMVDVEKIRNRFSKTGLLANGREGRG
jgi:Tfp pilus assembly protein PilX